MHSKQKLQLRVISALLCAAFAAQELQAAPISGAISSSLPPQEQLIKHPEAMEVPLDFVQLSEVHRGPKDVFIIHIQDAHSNVSGQQNLASALDALMQRYGIRLVLSEGGEGDCSLTSVKKTASKTVWERVAKSFLLRGEIQGEEYLNLTSEHPMKIVGVEDMGLYDTSLSSYSELAEKREKALGHLRSIEVAVEKVKNRLYPQVLKKYEALKKKDGGFEKTFPELMRLRSEAGLEPGGAETTKLAEALAKEAALNLGLANLERAAMLEELHRKGRSSELETALALEKKIGWNKTALLAHFEKTLNIARENGIDISKYDNLNAYLDYLRSFALIDMAALLTEIGSKENELYEMELQGDAALVRSVDRFITLLRSAHEVRMTTDEHERFKAAEPDFGVASLEGFLNRKLAEQGYYDDLIPADMTLDEARKAIDDFYDSVSMRDIAFIKNIEKNLQAEEQKTAFLITGGYHTEHLTELLAEKGYGYAVLTPIVTSETSQKKYETLLLGNRKAKQSTLRPALLTMPQAGARLSALMSDAKVLTGSRDVPTTIPAGARLAGTLKITTLPGEDENEALFRQWRLKEALGDKLLSAQVLWEESNAEQLTVEMKYIEDPAAREGDVYTDRIIINVSGDRVTSLVDERPNRAELTREQKDALYQNILTWLLRTQGYRSAVLGVNNDPRSRAFMERNMSALKEAGVIAKYKKDETDHVFRIDSAGNGRNAFFAGIFSMLAGTSRGARLANISGDRKAYAEKIREESRARREERLKQQTNFMEWMARDPLLRWGDGGRYQSVVDPDRGGRGGKYLRVSIRPTPEWIEANEKAAERLEEFPVKGLAPKQGVFGQFVLSFAPFIVKGATKPKPALFVAEIQERRGYRNISKKERARLDLWRDAFIQKLFEYGEEHGLQVLLTPRPYFQSKIDPEGMRTNYIEPMERMGLSRVSGEFMKALYAAPPDGFWTASPGARLAEGPKMSRRAFLGAAGAATAAGVVALSSPSKARAAESSRARYFNIADGQGLRGREIISENVLAVSDYRPGALFMTNPVRDSQCVALLGIATTAAGVRKVVMAHVSPWNTDRSRVSTAQTRSLVDNIRSIMQSEGVELSGLVLRAFRVGRFGDEFADDLAAFLQQDGADVEFIAHSLEDSSEVSLDFKIEQSGVVVNGYSDGLSALAGEFASSFRYRVTQNEVAALTHGDVRAKVAAAFLAGGLGVLTWFVASRKRRAVLRALFSSDEEPPSSGARLAGAQRPANVITSLVLPKEEFGKDVDLLPLMVGSARKVLGEDPLLSVMGAYAYARLPDGTPDWQHITDVDLRVYPRRTLKESELIDLSEEVMKGLQSAGLRTHTPGMGELMRKFLWNRWGVLNLNTGTIFRISIDCGPPQALFELGSEGEDSHLVLRTSDLFFGNLDILAGLIREHGIEGAVKINIDFYLNRMRELTEYARNPILPERKPKILKRLYEFAVMRGREQELQWLLASHKEQERLLNKKRFKNGAFLKEFERARRVLEADTPAGKAAMEADIRHRVDALNLGVLLEGGAGARLADAYKADIFPALEKALAGLSTDRPKLLLIVGMSGAGKSTLASNLKKYLTANGKAVRSLRVDNFIRDIGRFERFLTLVGAAYRRLAPWVSPRQAWDTFVRGEVDRANAAKASARIQALPKDKIVIIEGVYAEELFGTLPNSVKVFVDADATLRRESIRTRTRKEGALSLAADLLLTLTGAGKTTRGLLEQKPDFDFVLDVSDRQHPVFTKQPDTARRGARLANDPKNIPALLDLHGYTDHPYDDVVWASDIEEDGLRVIVLRSSQDMSSREFSSEVVAFRNLGEAGYEMVAQALVDEAPPKMRGVYTSAKVPGEGFMRRAIKLLLKNGVISLWESDIRRNEQSNRMYAALREDTELVVMAPEVTGRGYTVSLASAKSAAARPGGATFAVSSGARLAENEEFPNPAPDIAISESNVDIRTLFKDVLGREGGHEAYVLEKSGDLRLDGMRILVLKVKPEFEKDYKARIFSFEPLGDGRYRLVAWIFAIFHGRRMTEPRTRAWANSAGKRTGSVERTLRALFSGGVIDEWVSDPELDVQLSPTAQSMYKRMGEAEAAKKIPELSIVKKGFRYVVTRAEKVPVDSSDMLVASGARLAGLRASADKEMARAAALLDRHIGKLNTPARAGKKAALQKRADTLRSYQASLNKELTDGELGSLVDNMKELAVDLISRSSRPIPGKMLRVAISFLLLESAARRIDSVAGQLEYGGGEKHAARAVRLRDLARKLRDLPEPFKAGLPRVKDDLKNEIIGKRGAGERFTGLSSYVFWKSSNYGVPALNAAISIIDEAVDLHHRFGARLAGAAGAKDLSASALAYYQKRRAYIDELLRGRDVFTDPAEFYQWFEEHLEFFPSFARGHAGEYLSASYVVDIIFHAGYILGSDRTNFQRLVGSAERLAQTEVIKEAPFFEDFESIKRWYAENRPGLAYLTSPAGPETRYLALASVVQMLFLDNKFEPGNYVEFARFASAFDYAMSSEVVRSAPAFQKDEFSALEAWYRQNREKLVFKSDPSRFLSFPSLVSVLYRAGDDDRRKIAPSDYQDFLRRAAASAYAQSSDLIQNAPQFSIKKIEEFIRWFETVRPRLLTRLGQGDRPISGSYLAQALVQAGKIDARELQDFQRHVGAYQYGTHGRGRDLIASAPAYSNAEEVIAWIDSKSGELRPEEDEAGEAQPLSMSYIILAIYHHPDNAGGKKLSKTLLQGLSFKASAYEYAKKSTVLQAAPNFKEQEIGEYLEWYRANREGLPSRSGNGYLKAAFTVIALTFTVDNQTGRPKIDPAHRHRFSFRAGAFDRALEDTEGITAAIAEIFSGPDTQKGRSDLKRLVDEFPPMALPNKLAKKGPPRALNPKYRRHILEYAYSLYGKEEIARISASWRTGGSGARLATERGESVSGGGLAARLDDRSLIDAQQLLSDEPGLRLLAAGGQSLPVSFAWLTPRGVAVIGVSGNVISLQGVRVSRAVIPDEVFEVLREEKLFGAVPQSGSAGLSKPAMEYAALVRLGLKALKTEAETDVVLIRNIDRSLPEAEHVQEILASREWLGKNVYFEFFDKNTAERLSDISDAAGSIPKNAQRVLLGEAAEVEQAAQNGWRFVSTESPDLLDGQAGLLPLAAVFVSGILVGRADSILGNDLATQFFRQVTQSVFGQEQYSLFVKPVPGKTEFYDRISVKNLLRIPVGEILQGARLALQAIGSAA